MEHASSGCGGALSAAKEPGHAVDDFRGSAGAVGARSGELVYPRRLHPHLARHRDRGGPDPDHPGTTGRLIPTPRADPGRRAGDRRRG